MINPRTALITLSTLSFTLAIPRPSPSDTPNLGGGQAEQQIRCDQYDKQKMPYTWECVEAVQGALKSGRVTFTPENPHRTFTSGKCLAVVGLPHETSPMAQVDWLDVQFGFSHLLTACARSGPSHDILHRSAGRLLLGPDQKIQVHLSKPPKEGRDSLSATNGTEGGTIDWATYNAQIADINSSGTDTNDQDDSESGNSITPVS